MKRTEFFRGYDLGLANGLRLAGVKLGQTHTLVAGKLRKIRRRPAQEKLDRWIKRNR